MYRPLRWFIVKSDGLTRLANYQEVDNVAIAPAELVFVVTVVEPNPGVLPGERLGDERVLLPVDEGAQ